MAPCRRAEHTGLGHQVNIDEVWFASREARHPDGWDASRLPRRLTDLFSACDRLEKLIVQAVTRPGTYVKELAKAARNRMRTRDQEALDILLGKPLLFANLMTHNSPAALTRVQSHVRGQGFGVVSRAQSATLVHDALAIGYECLALIGALRSSGPIFRSWTNSQRRTDAGSSSCRPGRRSAATSHVRAAAVVTAPEVLLGSMQPRVTCRTLRLQQRRRAATLPRATRPSFGVQNRQHLPRLPAVDGPLEQARG